MDMFTIQHEWKFSEQVLKRLSTKDGRNPTSTDYSSEFTEIEEIPGIHYRMDLDINYIKMGNKPIHYKPRISFPRIAHFYPFISFSGLGKSCIRGNVTFLIKSANFDSKIRSTILKSSSCGVGVAVCTVDDLFNPEKKFIVNGECYIEFKGVFYLESSIERCTYQRTLAQYLWNRDDQDFPIVVGKENEYMVHKCVLAARSSVFDALLYTNMKEKAENKVEINDFDAQTVKNAIEFCYDRKYNLIRVKDATSLFRFADKYDIQDLKDSLEEYLSKAASPENICEIANASIVSNSPKLRDFCFQTMLLYSKMKFSIDHTDILDRDFAFELFKTTFSS